MDWTSVLLGVVLGIFLLPTLFMLGLRLLLWLLARKVRKMVKQLEQNGGQAGGANWQVQTFGFGLPNAEPTPEIVQPALSPEVTPHDRLCQRFLEQTALSSVEWDQVKDRLAFVHDDLTIQELEDMGFEPTGLGTPREQVEGQSQLLGSLPEPNAADVYVRLS